jgi:dihydroorotase
MSVQTITIGRPDDMHLHVREGARMQSVVPHTARQFARAIVMPNTSPFIVNVTDARVYHDEILQAVPGGMQFAPLMTLYLQTTMTPDTIRAAKKSGFVHGIKMYPHGATTNSHGGVVNVRDVYDQLHVMEEVDMPLLIHGESADALVDVFHRENVFYRDAFEWLTATFPKLRIVFEHITTTAAVRWIVNAPAYVRIGATITAQHLLVNRNYLLGGMLRPHAFCKPILKEEADRVVLLEAATSGNPRFFLGTDSAPHAQHGEPNKAKEVDCGCAGCFTAHAALELYAEAFDSVGQIDRLGDFASKFGAAFYELPPNTGSVTLERQSWKAQSHYVFGRDIVVPFRQEVDLQWKIVA